MPKFVRDYLGFCRKRGLWIVLAAAVIVITAGMGSLSLKAYDDCYYARKGVEMMQRGPSFTVTWGGERDSQNPPLQFWLLGASFAVFGENDFAARLPALLMTLGLLLMLYRIGHLIGDRSAGVVACALLLITPVFLLNARRCMMEIPLAFWTTGALLVFLEGTRRPRLHTLLALPLAAAILTKSVLGLFPLLVLAGLLASPVLRKHLRNPWLWLGGVVGLALGASWTIHQTLEFGPVFLGAHYSRFVLSRSVAPSSPAEVFIAYPSILVEFYEPIVIVALVGLVVLVRERVRKGSSKTDILISWVLVPLVVYSLAASRNQRYIFPILPGLALAGGWFMSRKLPRVSTALTSFVVPLVCVVAAFLFWFRPTVLVSDWNRTYKEHRALAREEFPPGSVAPYLGGDYWTEANPALYYWGVLLDDSGVGPRQAILQALVQPHDSLICVEERLPDIAPIRVAHEVVVEGHGWLWLRFDGDPSPGNAPGNTPGIGPESVPGP